MFSLLSIPSTEVFAQTLGTSTLPELTPLQRGAMDPFVFSGTSNIEAEGANRQGTGSQIPENYWRLDLVPTFTTYGVPFSLNILLSSEQNSVRQNIDGFGLALNPQYYQDILRQKVSDKIDELQNSDEIKKIQAIKDAYGPAALEDSVRAQAPGAVKDLDSFQVLQKLQDIRSGSIGQHLDDIKGLGLMSSAENFFSNFPTLAVGVTYPNFTPFTLSGVPVTGANIEWTPGDFYFAVAGGQTQKAIINDTTTVTYQNSLYAGAIGVGKRNETHFHVTALFANDNGTAPPISDTALADSNLLFQNNGPKSNYVLGADLLVIADPHFSFAGEISGSMLTGNKNDPSVQNNDIPSWLRSLFDPKISSFIDYSYNAQATLNLPESNSKLIGSVRRVGPGYYSLGVPNLRNDDFRYEAKLDQSFDKHQIAVSGFFRDEHDNLIPWKQTTTTIQSYGVSLGLNFRKLPYLRFNYSPYTQSSVITDSALAATPGSDSLRINNVTRIISVMTGYNIVLGKNVVSTNLSYSQQQTASRFGIGDYSSNNYNLNEIVNLSIPVTFSAGLGLIQPHTTPDTVGAIVTVDLSGTFTLDQNWSNTIGISIAKQQNIDSRTGFYINASFPVWKFGNLTVRAERNIYIAQAQSAITGPPFIPYSGSYNEFLMRVTFTKSW